jgi:hypothetical protein
LRPGGLADVKALERPRGFRRVKPRQGGRGEMDVGGVMTGGSKSGQP